MALKIIQTNFTSGELDPLLVGRVDVKHYYGGAARLRNVLVLPQGGVRRRPGLEYIDELPNQISRVTAAVTITAPNNGTTANANDDDTATELTTTVNISTTNPYVVVHYDLGSAKTIMFADVVGARLSAGSNSTEWFIQYSADNVTFTSLGNAVPMSIDDHHRRSTGPITARYWRFARIGATDMSTAKATIDEFTLWEETATLSAVRLPAFEFSTTEHYQLVFTDRNCAVYRNKVWQADVRTPFTSAQLANGQVFNWTQSLDTGIFVHEDVAPQKLVRQGDHDEWQMETLTFEFTPYYAFTEVRTAQAQTLTPSAKTGSVTLTAGGGTIFSAASENQYIEGNGGRARIVQYVSATVVKAVTTIDFLDTTAIAINEWDLLTGYEAAWSATRGYPRSAVFHEGRLIFGGSKSRPSTLWGSRVGQFFNFDPGQLLDDEAFDYTIGSDDVPAIINIRSAKTIEIFTSSSEYFIPQSANNPLTPANISIRRATSRGSLLGVRAVDVSGSTLFLQKEGKALREFLYNNVEDNYTATNISLLSSHLLVSPVDLALRKSTSTDEADFVLIVNGDGTLAVLTTLRDQEVTAWSLCTTDGDFLAAGVDQTEMYFAIERSINGVTVRYLEVFNSSLHVDCGVLYTTASPLTTLSGLDHLNGELVKVIADSAVLGDETVAGGAVTPDRAAETSAEVGLDFSPLVRNMPLVLQLQDGTHMDRKKRVSRVMLELYQTSDILVDGRRPAFRQFGGAGTGSPLDAAVTPYTGRKIIDGRLGWDALGQLDITQEFPVPMTLLSMELQVEL